MSTRQYQTTTTVHYFTEKKTDVEELRMTMFHANSTPFPTIEVGEEYKSNRYITRTLFVDGNIKFAIEDAVIQPVSSARNSGYGVEFITISLPNNFIDYLRLSTGSQLYNPIPGERFTWFNVQIVADFGGFRMEGSEIRLPMDEFFPGNGFGVVTRMLFNAYTSRPEYGGQSYIRFRLHDAEIKSFMPVTLPSHTSTPSRLPATPSRLPATPSRLPATPSRSPPTPRSPLTPRIPATPSRTPARNRSTSEDLPFRGRTGQDGTSEIKKEAVRSPGLIRKLFGK